MDQASASSLVGTLQASDGQMFEVDAGVKYQVIHLFQGHNQSHVFWDSNATVILETFQQRDGGAKRVELILKVSTLDLYFCWSVGPDVLTVLLFLGQDPQDNSRQFRSSQVNFIYIEPFTIKWSLGASQRQRPRV